RQVVEQQSNESLRAFNGWRRWRLSRIQCLGRLQLRHGDARLPASGAPRARSRDGVLPYRRSARRDVRPGNYLRLVQSPAERARTPAREVRTRARELKWSTRPRTPPSSTAIE